MRKITKGHGLTGAFLAAVVIAAIMLLLAAGLLISYFGEGADAFTTGLVVVYALVFLAISVGVVIALIQRWREVRGGEEDEAKKY
ncbi:MAG: hypothetical protein VB071_12835 [Lawsonibacter sp.]|nr:hypothetical protein [Lawsonibacter sp.]